MTPPPDPERAVAEAREQLVNSLGHRYRVGATEIEYLFGYYLDRLLAVVRADERARLLSGQQDADAHGEALRRHEAGDHNAGQR